MIAKKETQIGDPQKVCRRSMPHARRVLGASPELELLSGSGQDSASLLTPTNTCNRLLYRSARTVLSASDVPSKCLNARAPGIISSIMASKQAVT